MATAAAVAVVVYSCNSQKENVDSIDLTSVPMQCVNDMHIIQTENGILKARVEAPLMERYDNDSTSYELFPQGITVYSYTDESRLETIITADNAKHENFKKINQETWAAFGNVVLNNIIEKQIMETDTLYWNATKEVVHTDCYVKMYSPDGFMQGYGMESDQKTRNTIILKPFNSYGVVVKDSTLVVVDSVNFIGPMPKKNK